MTNQIFEDPDPALIGPPTQTISGVVNKAPVVDNVNIKLPSQEVKNLTSTSATDAIKKSTSNVNIDTEISKAQGIKNGKTSFATDKLNSTGIKPDGLGKDWSPDKYSPESIAGNTKYVDAKTGQIGSTAILSKTSDVTTLGGGQAALIGAASGGVVGAAAAKLASVQQGLPKPNIPKPPNTPRIKTIKIPRPDSTKGTQALLNLPKSPTF